MHGLETVLLFDCRSGDCSGSHSVSARRAGKRAKSQRFPETDGLRNASI